MQRTLLAISAVAMLGIMVVGAAWAANGYQLECLNLKCGYKGECTLGPLMAADSIDGYCAACNKWVRLEWRTRVAVEQKENPPTPLGKVWSAETGKTVTVYGCPNCKGPFVPVTQKDFVKDSPYAKGVKLGTGDGFMHCPKCGEPSLKMHLYAIED
jgi:hypothetical protein